jgi:hypothetical protein
MTIINLKTRPQKSITLDKSLCNNDQMKTNTAFQMEEKIEFKAIRR